ncbi:MAG: bifunctional (p)ppGpp synthetase/guanosine-3',5'-bis(diphosphate) 3'-pyrophosphohydrolase [Synergistaceae bacterium]|jgi:GTP pyrophosphokinase|nr:bifunctional (p)ppGpp synthetase/guanosine-3',5'-bis(diphosphate) 3'-pyrophosphohydrolase [Synergistaceae bacterium]
MEAETRSTLGAPDAGDEHMDLSAVRDSLFDQLPDECKTESVKTAWRLLWSRAVSYQAAERMNDLGKAMLYAAKEHAGQKRTSGDPYIVHTINVAAILADMQLDVATLCAALLHDILEDTEVTVNELSAVFGDEVVTLVDGVTKLGKLPFMSMDNYQAENIRKMFIVMARDIRVVLIKLADRLHNMRTLSVLRRDKQERIARETLEIFAPLAHRLGIYQLKRDLEDLSFKYLHPEIYNEIRRKVRHKLPEREEVIRKGIEAMEERLAAEGIPCKIKGRAKHYYSIYEKMERKKISIDELYDILAMRVLVDDMPTCYAVLGIVHSMWTPIPLQFDDYIANPKSNMYQSLHTTVMAFGAPLEIQIRTKEMDRLAEYGIAAHWLYKSGNASKSDSLDAKLTWVRQALEGEGHDPEEFLEILKSDVLTSEVYAFTPRGKAVVLPRGATTIDFAYAVHTEVGNRCVGAMVGGRIVPLATEIRNGDIVKIITSPQGAPSRDWMKMVKSAKTRAKIRNYFRQAEKVDREEKARRGWEALNKELRKRGLEFGGDEASLTPSLNKVARDVGLSGKEDLLVAIGGGSAGPSAIAQKLVLSQLQQKGESDDVLTKHSVPKKSNLDIIVEGFEGVQAVLANCCAPIPGDAIVGCSTRLRGITVHRADCTNIAQSTGDRNVNVSWSESAASGRLHTARIKAEAMDRADLVRDAAQVIGQAGGSIQGMKMNVVDNSLVRMKIELQVKNLGHLYEITGKLNAVKGMIEVERA